MGIVTLNYVCMLFYFLNGLQKHLNQCTNDIEQIRDQLEFSILNIDVFLIIVVLYILEDLEYYVF